MFTDELIEVEMFFISKPNAHNIKAVIINHTDHPFRKVKPLSHSSCRYSLVILNFVGGKCVGYLAILYTYWKASNLSLLQYFGQISWVVAKQSQKLWQNSIF